MLLAQIDCDVCDAVPTVGGVYFSSLAPPIGWLLLIDSHRHDSMSHSDRTYLIEARKPVDTKVTQVHFYFSILCVPNRGVWSLDIGQR
jgi:hypothetical protein